MKTIAAQTLVPKNHIARILLATVGILLVPLLAMQFSSDVNWSLMDFVIMGCLLFATGLLLDTVWHKGGKYRGAGAVVVVVLFLWLWAELAVGVFTHWGS